MSESKYYSQFTDLAENSVNVNLKSLYGSCSPLHIDEELPILFQLQTGKRSRSTIRDPLNIAAVLDRSGSMRGAKLTNCLNSIVTLIENMIDDDMLTLIDYDDRVRTHFSCLRKSEALEWLDKIKAIESAGWTNISDGLKSAVSQLTESESTSKRVVFLFSDGNANKGITNLPELTSLVKEWYTEHKIYVTTYGIGSDFNEKWMREIAKAGKGSYFYIDMKDIEKTTDMLRRGFKEFSRQVCSDLEVSFSAEDGTKITEVRGKRDMESLLRPCKLGNLEEHELVQFIVKIKPTADFCNLKCTYSYKSSEGAVCLRTVSGKLEAFTTTEKMLTLDPDAHLYSTIVECGELEQQVSEHLAAGKKADAVALKREIIEKYKSQLEHDRFGLLEQLVKSSSETLTTISTETNAARVAKAQNYSSNYAVQQATYYACESDEESAGGAGGMFADDDDDW